MLIHPLAERLRAVGMAAMADAFLEMQSQPAATDLTREDWLGLLLIAKSLPATASASPGG
jgi:hypothetical protein